MRRFVLLSILLISFSTSVYLTGCTTGGRISPRVEGMSPDAQPTEPIVLKPAPAIWYIGDRPAVSKGGFTFAVHVVELTERQTTLIYSVSGPNVREFMEVLPVQMTDDRDRAYEFYRVTPLASLDQLQLGALVFGPRQPGARELHVLVHPITATKSNDASPLDAVVAKVVGTVEDPSFLAAGNYSLYRDEYMEQADYRLSFNAWALYKGDRVARMLSERGLTTEELLRPAATEKAPLQRTLPTPTPVPVAPLAGELSAGEPIRTEATLRIEDIQSSQVVYYLYVVFLMDGRVKATLLQ